MDLYHSNIRPFSVAMNSRMGVTSSFMIMSKNGIPGLSISSTRTLSELIPDSIIVGVLNLNLIIKNERLSS